MRLNLKVADFTGRLPGPLAGALLADLGAKVLKVEIEGAEDPFLGPAPEKLFNVWARNFSSNKKTVLLEKERADTAIADIIAESDAVLCPAGGKIASLSKKHPHTLFVEVAGGSGKRSYLHDLNALFLTRSFKLYLEGNTEEPRPPYLPMAGIVFAQQIALETLAAQLAKREDSNSPNIKVYLDQAAKNVLDKFWSPELNNGDEHLFLHNGKYPCYNIYKTKNGGHVAVAAVESRFWNEFVKVFKLSLLQEDRFDDSGKTGQILAEMFLNYKTSEVTELIGERDICVNVFALD